MIQILIIFRSNEAEILVYMYEEYTKKIFHNKFIKNVEKWKW